MSATPMRVRPDVTDSVESAGASAPFNLTVRVYYEDTDTGGVVYYANYLKFFERARTEWLRHLGIAQQALRDTTGIQFVVASAAIDYHAPARLDDEVLIHTRIGKLGRVALTFEQQAWRKPAENDAAPVELLASGQIKVGCVDQASLRPVALPATLRERFKAFAHPVAHPPGGSLRRGT